MEFPQCLQNGFHMKRSSLAYSEKLVQRIMAWRRKRTAPTVTELLRVEDILSADPALRRFLSAKDSPVRKRNGELVHFYGSTVAVAKELMARKLNPERAHVRIVLKVAADVMLRGNSRLKGHQ